MVIIDTNIFIGALRGNAEAGKYLQTYQRSGFVSIITELELLVGAKSKLQKQQAEIILNAFDKLKINNEIYLLAKRLLKEYNTNTKSLYLPDAIIAATALEMGYSLLTYNHADYRFIKGLILL
jgi:predicted nucleic acid-binding protein